MDELIPLEYHKILDRLAVHAVSDPGKEMCRGLKPYNTCKDAQKALEQTDAAMQILQRYGAPSFSDLKNIVSSARRAQNGATLAISELIAIADLLRIVRGLRENRPSESGALTESFDILVSDVSLENSIHSAFPSPEEVSDGASSALRDIRRKQSAARARIRNVLDGYLRSAGQYLQDAIVTIRNDRYVLPVRAECRNDVPGLVHDTSSSGATVFIEPMAVVNANNEIAVLVAEERREIDKILMSFSQQVGDRADWLVCDFNTVCFFDFCFAKARYATEISAFLPNLTEDGITLLTAARHPLISKDTVVPIDISIGKDYSVLIVTGPNTGGKTVSLKTLGLACLMAKSGLFVCAKEGSCVAFYDRIFADIGDEQSIEQSLSTFSAHMTHIISILGQITDRSLVLLDELGSGTDPSEGAALAMSIIESIQSMGAKVMCTTHYAELKLYALQTPDVENASCEFDVSTLRPTYRLITGIPGKSNAFAIVQKLGMDDLVIEGAKYHLDHETVKLERVLADLETTRKTLEYDKKQAEELRFEAQCALNRAKAERAELEAQAQARLDEAKRKAADIVDQARRDTDRLLDEIDELRKEKDRADFRERVGAVKKSTAQALDQMESAVTPKKEKKPLPRPLRVGDTVKVLSLGKQATVLALPDNKKQVSVQVGIIKMKIKLDDLELVEQKTKVPQAPQGKSVYSLNRDTRDVSNEIDIRGMSILEAEPVVEGFLDRCRMTGLTTVSIIHGKGTGTLRQGVHSMLRKDKSVESFRLGVYGEGETGVTIVTLKQG
ncbi:MAG: endonuclease MutS2 [Clostridia bacterium]|nr:endonuclease MutS2 [Clostridia bacterium]